MRLSEGTGNRYRSGLPEAEPVESKWNRDGAGRGLCPGGLLLLGGVLQAAGEFSSGSSSLSFILNTEPFQLVPLDDPNYVAELLDFHQVLLKKLGAMRCQIDLFMVLAKQKVEGRPSSQFSSSPQTCPIQENLDLLVSEKLRYNDIFGDQVSGFFFLTNVYKSIAVI